MEAPHQAEAQTMENDWQKADWQQQGNWEGAGQVVAEGEWGAEYQAEGKW